MGDTKDREKDILGIEDLKYDRDGLIPAVIQQFDSLEVLMVAYMNADSVAKTIETGKTWFWSRSRQKYWMKGESSGHTQEVKEILYDCDADTLLVLVDQTGAACHTMARTCFYRRMYPVADAGPVESDDAGIPLS
jgi:phosphoribosyl-AMP cyclohydrolase